jgi:hypothetical protein
MSTEEQIKKARENFINILRLAGYDVIIINGNKFNAEKGETR